MRRAGQYQQLEGILSEGVVATARWLSEGKVDERTVARASRADDQDGRLVSWQAVTWGVDDHEAPKTNSSI